MTEIQDSQTVVLMAELDRRFQLLLTQEQMEFLKSLSEERGSSVGDLIRIAVDQYYRPSSPAETGRILKELSQTSFLHNPDIDSVWEE